MTDSNTVKQARVAFFDSKRGWGFVTPIDGGKDIFLHFTEIQMAGFKTVSANDLIEYEVGVSAKNGKPVAVNVRVIELPTQEADK